MTWDLMYANLMRMTETLIDCFGMIVCRAYYHSSPRGVKGFLQHPSVLSSVALSGGSTQFVQWEQSRGRGYPSRLRKTMFEFTDRLGRAGDMSWVLYSTPGVGASACVHRRVHHLFAVDMSYGRVMYFMDSPLREKGREYMNCLTVSRAGPAVAGPIVTAR